MINFNLQLSQADAKWIIEDVFPKAGYRINHDTLAPWRDAHNKAFTEKSLIPKNGTWTYAGTSFSLEDALIMNGFNEKMDGCKSLEDCEFGSRLQMLERSFVSDKEGIVYIVDHPSYSSYVVRNSERILIPRNHV